MYEGQPQKCAFFIPGQNINNKKEDLLVVLPVVAEVSKDLPNSLMLLNLATIKNSLMMAPFTGFQGQPCTGRTKGLIETGNKARKQKFALYYNSNDILR